MGARSDHGGEHEEAAIAMGWFGDGGAGLRVGDGPALPARGLWSVEV